MIRRAGVLALFLLVLVGGRAGSAAALPPPCPPTCSYTFSSQLRIAADDYSGTVTARSTSTGAVVFSCPPSSDWCVHTDSLTTTTPTRPTGPWPSYTLTVPSRTGFEPIWNTCGAAYSCQVTNDQPSQDLYLTGWKDVQAPTVSLSGPATIGPATTMTATASDNDGIGDYSWSVRRHSDGSLVGGVTGPTATTFSPAQPGMAPGQYDVSVTVYDYAYNSATAAVTVTLDTSVMLGVSAVAAYVPVAPAVSVTTDADASAVCSATGAGTATSPHACSGSFAPHLDADGAWTYTVRATDSVGNVSTVSRSFVLDTHAPVVAFTGGPADGAVLATGSAAWGFAVTEANLAAVTCSLDGGPATACSTQASYAGLGAGVHRVSVTAVDKAGNSTTLTRAVTVAPSAVASSQDAGPSTSVSGGARPRLAVSGLGAGATGTVAFVRHGSVVCRATVANGRASCRPPHRLRPGTYRVVARYSGDAHHAPAVLPLRFKVA